MTKNVKYIFVLTMVRYIVEAVLCDLHQAVMESELKSMPQIKSRW